MMMTPEQMLRVLEIEGQEIQYGALGEVYMDVDGEMLGVTRPTLTDATMGSLHATGPEWEALARYLYEKGKGNNV